jgi:hypothetical protein
MEIPAKIASVNRPLVFSSLLISLCTRSTYTLHPQCTQKPVNPKDAIHSWFRHPCLNRIRTLPIPKEEGHYLTNTAFDYYSVLGCSHSIQHVSPLLPRWGYRPELKKEANLLPLVLV